MSISPKFNILFGYKIPKNKVNKIVKSSIEINTSNFPKEKRIKKDNIFICEDYENTFPLIGYLDGDWDRCNNSEFAWSLPLFFSNGGDWKLFQGNS